jgi:hypothetical protein
VLFGNWLGGEDIDHLHGFTCALLPADQFGNQLNLLPDLFVRNRNALNRSSQRRLQSGFTITFGDETAPTC